MNFNISKKSSFNSEKTIIRDPKSIKINDIQKL